MSSSVRTNPTERRKCDKAISVTALQTAMSTSKAAAMTDSAASSSLADSTGLPPKDVKANRSNRPSDIGMEGQGAAGPSGEREKKEPNCTCSLWGGIPPFNVPCKKHGPPEQISPHQIDQNEPCDEREKIRRSLETILECNAANRVHDFLHGTNKESELSGRGAPELQN